MDMNSLFRNIFSFICSRMNLLSHSLPVCTACFFLFAVADIFLDSYITHSYQLDRSTATVVSWLQLELFLSL